MATTHINYSIRRATDSDIPRIVELCEQKRIEYQGYSPIFWKKAANSGEVHLAYLKDLIKSDDVFFLVAERLSAVNGFVIGAIASPPPVYGSGGKVCIVDDYNVSSPDLWNTVGKALLESAWQEALRREAKLLIVVCGQRDVPKRGMLQSSSLEVASEWFVGIPK